MELLGLIAGDPPPRKDDLQLRGCYRKPLCPGRLLAVRVAEKITHCIVECESHISSELSV